MHLAGLSVGGGGPVPLRRTLLRAVLPHRWQVAPVNQRRFDLPGHAGHGGGASVRFFSEPSRRFVGPLPTRVALCLELSHLSEPHSHQHFTRLLALHVLLGTCPSDAVVGIFSSQRVCVNGREIVWACQHLLKLLPLVSSLTARVFMGANECTMRANQVVVTASLYSVLSMIVITTPCANSLHCNALAINATEI
jgi:hypothetical protein